VRQPDPWTALPDGVLAIIAGFAQPPPAKGNGLDHDDPPPQPKAQPVKPRPSKGKPPPAEVAAAENALIEAIRANPGARTAKLATLTGSGTSTVIDRLRRLEKLNVIARTDKGWRANPTTPPSPSA
jgi:Winged helix-turn-helix DNA-binding